MKKVRVLMIISSLDIANGVTSYVMNYYRCLKNVKMDFVITSDEIKNDYYAEIIRNHDRVYFIKSNNMKEINKIRKQVKCFFKENATKYDIVHCNVANIGLFYLYYAKKYGIKTRILHSHATITADTFFHKIRNNMIIPLTIRKANVHFACSKAAGIAMFGRKDFFVINNAIDEKRFLYNKEYANHYKEELNIKNQDFIIGNIGRLSNQKNHVFMLNLIKELKKHNKQIKLVCVGNGPLEKTLKEKTKELNIENEVIFLGSRKDANKLYSLFDLFILPSLYEGLPVVGIEAQTNGVDCIFSDKITDESNVSGKVVFLPIDNANSVEKWCEKIMFFMNNRKTRQSCKFDSYDLEKNAQLLEKKYFKLLEENEK